MISARIASIGQRALALLLGAMAVNLPAPALAWGGEGHAVVAQIAELRLTPEARQQVHKLLALEGTANMSDVASWADQVKHTKTKRPAHTVRLVLNGSEVNPDNCPSRFCATKGIEYYTRVLRDKNAKSADKLEALKYVIHLVGDVHEPLHTSQITGGKIKINFEGEPTTLHKVWDKEIIRVDGGDLRTLAQRLNAQAGAMKATGQPIDWAVEGRNIARDVIFRCFPLRTNDTITLDQKYADAMWPIIRTRLTQAGVRLAALLNRSFAS